jgi:hypothetical protein
MLPSLPGFCYGCVAVSSCVPPRALPYLLPSPTHLLVPALAQVDAEPQQGERHLLAGGLPGGPEAEVHEQGARVLNGEIGDQSAVLFGGGKGGKR